MDYGSRTLRQSGVRGGFTRICYRASQQLGP